MPRAEQKRRPRAPSVQARREPEPSVPSPDEQARVAREIGVPLEELRFGARPKGRPSPLSAAPWERPLERSTQPPFAAPAHATYEAWLRATLADLAEHFRLAAARDAPTLEAASATRDVARVLRATALAYEWSDSRWLEAAGDDARRFLRRNAGKKIRVPTALYVELLQGSLNYEPSFELESCDVERTRAEAAVFLRHVVTSVLWRYRNPTPETIWLRRAAQELTQLVVSCVRGTREIARECSRLDSSGAVEEALTLRLPEAPRVDLPELSLTPPKTGLAKPALSLSVRQRDAAEALELFAEELVRTALGALGYPATRRRTLYDSVRKRTKK